MIIDSHTHLSYLDKNKSKKLSLVKNELILNMKKNKIFCSLVIPDNVPNPQCADLDNLLILIKNDNRLKAIGTLKITAINKINLQKIARLFKHDIIYGFKIFPGHDPIYPTDKRWQPIYHLCLKYNRPLIIHTGVNTNNTQCAKYNDPKHILEVAKNFPQLKIIIAHYFYPRLNYCFKITSGFNNIYFDTSGLADKEVLIACGGRNKIKNILIKTIKRNKSSVIFGTDWPMCDIKQHLNLIKSLAITAAEKEMIFYRNAKTCFGL